MLLVTEIIEVIQYEKMIQYKSSADYFQWISKGEYMKYIIRKMNMQEYPLLNDFLYDAIFIPDGAKAPSRDIISSPEMQVYIDQFGTRKDDHALATEADGKVVGAVWESEPA